MQNRWKKSIIHTTNRMQTNKKKMKATENKPERAYVKNMERNGDNTHTVQRLKAYHQSQQLMLLKSTHAMQHPTS